MTRLERLREKQAREKARKAQAQLREAQVSAQLRAEERKDRHRLHVRWGRILDQLGLLDVDEDILMDILKVTARNLAQDGHAMPQPRADVSQPDSDLAQIMAELETQVEHVAREKTRAV